MRKIELLAPAKNLECGIAAIDHGADAVYIGAQRFGARAAAGNSVDDIAELCRYAHQYGAKVYVTVNTIIYDHELDDTRALMQQLSAVHVDAFLVQDMGLLVSDKQSLNRETKDLHPSSLIPHLHASTQTDNRTAEKVAWLRSLGFRRVVLARELSVEEIAAIHQAVPDVELEVFVHGALCVSYSGQCYASQYCFGRSANRGECAQFCRLKFNLRDSDDRVIEHQRYLLSLKDMCRIDHLEELMEAGAVSFKIEGRLKDVAYVKNVVAAYSQRLNQIIDRHPDRYCRASQGRCTYTFTPNLQKTFNRGFTDYFLHGRQPSPTTHHPSPTTHHPSPTTHHPSPIFSPDTPKAMGEYVGKVKELRGNSFNVAGTASFANGDGLCFINDDRELEGFRVNRVQGNRLFPQQMPAHLRPGMALYRNHDQEFERLMAGKTAVRKIPITIIYRANESGVEVEASPTTHHPPPITHHPSPLALASKPQRDNIVRQLTKLGNTPFTCSEVIFENGADAWFVPSSVLADLRRGLVEQLLNSSDHPMTAETASAECVAPAETASVECVAPAESEPAVPPHDPYYARVPYLYNISNRAAQSFYAAQGLADVEPALEVAPQRYREPLLMQCRHCLRYALGYCVKRGGRKPTWREPLFLELPDKRRFRLEFDCKRCQMNMYGMKNEE